MKIPFEYFCKDCHQLRLNLADNNKKCGNCGSKNIIKGKIMGFNLKNIKEVINLKIYKMIEKMIVSTNDLQEDAIKVDKGNKAACTRVRVGLMGIIKDCKVIREAVIKVKKK